MFVFYLNVCVSRFNLNLFLCLSVCLYICLYVSLSIYLVFVFFCSISRLCLSYCLFVWICLLRFIASKLCKIYRINNYFLSWTWFHFIPDHWLNSDFCHDFKRSKESIGQEFSLSTFEQNNRPMIPWDEGSHIWLPSDVI